MAGHWANQAIGGKGGTGGEIHATDIVEDLCHVCGTKAGGDGCSVNITDPSSCYTQAYKANIYFTESASTHKQYIKELDHPQIGLSYNNTNLKDTDAIFVPGGHSFNSALTKPTGLASEAICNWNGTGGRSGSHGMWGSGERQGGDGAWVVYY